MLSSAVSFAVIGAASGGLYALLALGIVVVHRSTRVVNFAHAAVAVVAAYVYTGVRGLGLAPALVIALLTGIACGIVVDVVVMRPLRKASSLTRAIAAIGVLIVAQGLLTLKYGSYPTIVASFLPISPVRVGSVAVGADELIILAISLVLCAALFVFYRRSSFGVATTALAENRRALAALGRSPATVGLVNWGIAGGLAALAGVLLAPITGLTAGLPIVLIVPALSAALLGGLASFPLTLAGALIIGIAQSEVGRFTSVPGLQDSVPFFGILLVLALRGTSLPGRGYVADALPRVGRARVPWPAVAAATVAGTVALGWLLPDDWVAALTTSLITGVILLSLVVVTGYAGQLSLASYALAGVGALVAAILVSEHGWPFWAAAVVGILAAGLVGLVVGLPAVRIRGISLAVVTLGLAVTVQEMLLNNQSISQGTDGLPVTSPSLFGMQLNALFNPRGYGLFALAVFVLAGLGVLNLRRSSVGRRLIAVRANERAAASLGISVTRAKLYAFVVSGCIAAIGGILLAFANSIVTLSDPGGPFDPVNSINAVAEATIGGIGYGSGALIGTIPASGGVGNQVLQLIGHGDWLTVIGGLLLLLTVASAPDGVAANVARQLGPRLAALPRVPFLAGVPFLARRAQRPVDLAFEAAPVAAAVLEARDLTVAFGGTTALDGVSFTLRSGQVLGVIGPNGAGKTTLIDAVTGYTPPQAGQVLLDGRELGALGPHARSRRGLSRSFQSLELFEDLTVLENLLAASERRPWWHAITAVAFPGRPALPPAARAAVSELGLAGSLHAAPGELPYGDRRLLGIARALAGAPRVLLLDEPAAGLGERERAELRVLIRHIAERWHMAVLLIEHDVDLVMAVSDQVLALDFGRVIAAGDPETVRTDPLVVAAYLGEPAAATEPAGPGECSTAPVPMTTEVRNDR